MAEAIAHPAAASRILSSPRQLELARNLNDRHRRDKAYHHPSPSTREKLVHRGNYPIHVRIDQFGIQRQGENLLTNTFGHRQALRWQDYAL